MGVSHTEFSHVETLTVLPIWRTHFCPRNDRVNYFRWSDNIVLVLTLKEISFQNVWLKKPILEKKFDMQFEQFNFVRELN